MRVIDNLAYNRELYTPIDALDQRDVDEWCKTGYQDGKIRCILREKILENSHELAEQLSRVTHHTKDEWRITIARAVLEWVLQDAELDDPYENLVRQ